MISDCCGALVSVCGERSTHWWVCEDCGSPCDVEQEDSWYDHPSLTAEERNRSLIND
jgi:hypothetical protein